LPLRSLSTMRFSFLSWWSFFTWKKKEQRWGGVDYLNAERSWINLFWLYVY
jgi:hypothetical protein